jgi:hypothetical protein
MGYLTLKTVDVTGFSTAANWRGRRILLSLARSMLKRHEVKRFARTPLGLWYEASLADDMPCRMEARSWRVRVSSFSA